MFQKILVAIDDSELSRMVFDRALALAIANQSKLMLVHALTLRNDFYPSDTFIGISESAMRIYAEQLEQREQAGIKQMQLLTSAATAAGVAAEFTQKIGDPGQIICEVAKTWDANLIAIGRRGLSGLSELFMGSTSNYVLHHAPCDVLTIQGIAVTTTQPAQPQILAGVTD